MLKIKNCRWIFLIWEQTSSFGTYKSVNLEYDTLVCWADGANLSSTKRLMFQVFFFL